MQQTPMQPAWQQHQKAPDADQQQHQNMSDTVLSETHNAQTDLHNSKTLQKAGSARGLASMQDAARSLHSLQSGIQYEPYAVAAEASNRQEVDTTSYGSADDAEQLDYTGEDAEAMQALLALTSDCSVQSPQQPQHPAGKVICSQSCTCLILRNTYAHILQTTVPGLCVNNIGENMHLG